MPGGVLQDIDLSDEDEDTPLNEDTLENRYHLYSKIMSFIFYS
jgi:hypothetical protein